MTSREHRDPYGVLGVRRQASPDEIARAYRRAARATHPDSGGAGGGAERFQAVSDAYEVLRDPGRRAGYDRLHPVPRRQTAGAGGSVRYAAPGSQHVVLGSGVGEVDETASTQGLGDIEEMFRLALSLLHGSW
ncbi:MAG TPA: DnaJ domain-containing protein [Gaiella sp.]|jgi:molecular chaperone DnaJ|nr:DnaJ domain-containing protein [Gaiella sp.]